MYRTIQSAEANIAGMFPEQDIDTEWVLYNGTNFCAGYKYWQKISYDFSSTVDMIFLYDLKFKFPAKRWPSYSAVQVVELGTVDHDFEDMYPNEKLCPIFKAAEKKVHESKMWKDHENSLKNLTDYMKAAFNVTELPGLDGELFLYLLND